MTETRTLRAGSPADLLAIVPYVLGFHPQDSVVMLSHACAGQPFHARIDLPDDPDDIPATAQALAAPAGRHGVRRVAAVVYTDDAHVADAVCDALDEALSRSGTLLTLALRADGERWYPLGGPAVTDGAAGTPYDLSCHPLTAQAVLEGQVTHRSRQELADSLVGTDPEATEAVTAAAEAAVARMAAAGRHQLGGASPGGARRSLVQEGSWVRDRIRRFLADREPLTHDDAGRMVAALTSIEVRDVAWSEMSRHTAVRHVELWRDLVRRCPYDLVAAPAGLLGFAAWLDGDGALAWCAVDRCQACEPDYRLAGLLSQALTGAVPPSTWRPPPGDALPLFTG